MWGGSCLCERDFRKSVRMPSLISRPTAATIVSPSPPSSRSKRNRSDTLPRGYTARNSSGKTKSNPYHEKILARIGTLKREERTGCNRLVTIGNLHDAADAVVCKECVKEEVESERRRCIQIISQQLVNKAGPQDKEGYICEFTALLEKMQADAQIRSCKT